jgi:hypothetical protein
MQRQQRLFLLPGYYNCLRWDKKLQFERFKKSKSSFLETVVGTFFSVHDMLAYELMSVHEVIKESIVVILRIYVTLFYTEH